TATASVTVTQPTVLSASGTATNVSCNAGSNGSVDLTVTGGTAPYTYLWNNTATTQDLSGLTAGIYEVTVTDANGCTATASVTVTQPTVLSASGTATNVSCNAGSNGAVDLTVTGGTAPYTYVWNNTATTEDLTGLEAGIYDVTVTDANGCTATTSVTVTQPEAIVVAAEVDTNVSCFEGTDGSVTINLTNGVAPFEYVIDGTTWSGVPEATLSVEGLSAGTYPISVTDANGCTATGSVTITEPAEVMPPAAAAQVFCNFATVAELEATGTAVQWYADETGGTALADTASLSTGTYYATQTVEGCESPTRTAVAITVNITPAPSASAQTFCNAATIADLTASGTDVQWYAAATGGTALADDTALATGTYYVSQTLNDCESARTAVTITVNVTPAPTAAAQTFCNAGTVADLVATGTDLKWYANATGGVQLVGTANLSTGTYYVSQTLNACEGPRTAVAVTVNVTPAPPAVAQVFCNNATVADLTATGINIQWYSAATGGTALADDTALATGTYYASQTQNDCESATRTAVAVTLNVTVAPTADAQTFCNTATVADLAATGTVIQWYANATGGTALADDTALATGTYYASQTLNDCESPRVAVAVTLNVTVAPTADAQTFCNTATVADLAATGTAIQWYANATGGTALANDTALATGTYYATQTLNDCESPRVAVAVTVNVTPAPAADAQAFCDAATVADLIATGDNLQWYADATGGTALAGDVALTDATTYYVSQTIDGCESADRTAVAVTITTTAAPAAEAQTLCEGAMIADLVATGTEILWYADQTAIEPLAGDTVLTNGMTYYATQTIDGCESLTRTAVAVTITVTPAPTGDTTQINGPEDTLADLEVAGVDITWYASAEDAAAHVNPLDPATVLEDGVTYYATQTIDGCESQASLGVTVTISLRVDTFTKDKLSYYPVPVIDILTIENTNRINNVTFINLLGQVVLTQEVNATSARIDMRALQGATYIMQVTTDSGSITVKVIKNAN
ncbi:T9SS type A sorting domain-containing protein, partial [Flavobacterium sp. LaA7.5]|nr:T9SS type A sorting domain-containing protein [Flavobacterium salilacus subsp. altitudinum]